MQTQADLAQVEEVGRRTLRTARVRDRTPEQFLEHSSASPKGDTDLLRLSVTDPSPAIAKRLATAYARAFSAYRSALDTNKLALARPRGPPNTHGPPPPARPRPPAPRGSGRPPSRRGGPQPGGGEGAAARHAADAADGTRHARSARAGRRAGAAANCAQRGTRLL